MMNYRVVIESIWSVVKTKERERERMMRVGVLQRKTDWSEREREIEESGNFYSF